jgi:hypothetical protein
MIYKLIFMYIYIYIIIKIINIKYFIYKKYVLNIFKY